MNPFLSPANTENLTILAKSVESDDLARMILTRDELGLGQEAHEARQLISEFYKKVNSRRISFSYYQGLHV